MNSPRSSRHFRCSLALAAGIASALVSLGSASAQTEYSFTGDYAGFETAYPALVPYNGNSVDHLGIEVGHLNKVGMSASNKLNGSSMTGGLDLTKYIEFSVSPDAGFSLAMDHLSFSLDRPNLSGIRSAQWRSSVDGFAAPITSYSSVNASLSVNAGVISVPDALSTFSGNVLDLSGSQFQNLSETVTFRLYMYGAETGSGRGGLGDSFSFSGSATGAPGALPRVFVPAPSLSTATDFKKLPIMVPEASGITYDRGTDSLVAVGDAGNSLAFFGRAGDLKDYNNLGGFQDVEAISAYGNNKFLIADERVMTVSVVTVDPLGNFFDKDGSPTYSFGEAAGNQGLEGVAYDRLANEVWGVKEMNPLRVAKMTNFGTPESTVVDAFDASLLGLTDLSDIFMLSASALFDGTEREANLLILSQASNRIVEVTRDGTIVDSLDLSFLGLESIEGLTMDDEGMIYLTAEGNKAGESTLIRLGNSVLIPEPSSTLLCLSAAGLLALRRSRRRA